MSLDRSLKSTNALERHRNVLTRAERLDLLADEDRWEEGQSVFGLPKVSHRKGKQHSKPKKEKDEDKAEAPAAGEATDEGGT